MENLIPESWKEAQLIDLLETLENGSRPQGGVQGINEGIPSIGGEHLDYNGGFKLNNIKYIPETFANKMNRGQIKPNDILIVKDGATTGKTSYVDSKFPYKRAFVNEHVFICRTLKSIESIYISYFLRSKEGQVRILENFTGSAQGGINQKFASNTLIPIPPLAEQTRLVAKLDALFAHTDTLKTKLDRIPQLLKNFRQQVLTQAVTGKLTEDWRVGKELEEFDMSELPFIIPLAWKFQELKILSISLKYGSSSKSLDKGKVPVLRMGNLQNGKIDWSDLKYSSDDAEIKKYSLKKGDLLFNRTNSPELVGKTSIYNAEMPALYAGYLIKIETKDNLAPEFLNFVLNSQYAKKWCWEVKTDGVSQSNINAQKLGDFIIPLPPLKEQQEIIKRVEELFRAADAIESQYQSLKEKIDSLPQAILNKAFKGELVPQDPNDEPASVLLERIRREKAKAK